MINLKSLIAAMKKEPTRLKRNWNLCADKRGRQHRRRRRRRRSLAHL
jgi:hypothetical protein